MRLLLLITDLDLGGTPTVVRELAIRLRSPSLHVEVACLKPAGVVGDQLRAAGVEVHSLNATRPWQLPRVVRELAELVRVERFDVVFSFLVHANLVAHLAAKRLGGVRFTQSIQTTQPRPGWHWRAQRAAASSAEAIVVPSESVARVAQEWSNVPTEKLLIIPNAVDTHGFRGTSASLVNHERGAHATFCIGFVGRLDPIKRVPDLVAAMKSLDPSFELHIYGDGPERAAIERSLNDDLRDRVTLHGMIADARVAYANLDVLVLPSDAEGFGLVLIEAMAAGVPVIGTNVDGIRDVIRDGETGLLVPPRDPTALAAAIRRLREDQSMRDRFLRNARGDIERRFAWPAVLASYRALLGVTG